MTGRKNVCKTVIALLYASLLLYGCAPTPVKENSRLEKNMHRMRSSYFAVKCHKSGNPDVLRKAHITARLITSEPDEKLFAFYKQDKLPMYVYVFDGHGLLMLKRFGTKKKAFMDDRINRDNLKRNPSLFDPAIVEKLKQRVIHYARGYAEKDVIAMCVCHEGSYTLFSAPLDYDYSDFALTAFRKWLKKRYTLIEKLNKAWDRNYTTFDKIIPDTTDMKIDNEYKNGSYMDLRSWFEFREFMDEYFVNLIHTLADLLRKNAPAIPTSVTVTALPSVYSGWDYGRLLPGGEIDVLETWKWPGDKGLIRGLTRGKTISFSSHYGDKPEQIRKLWLDFLNGERGTFLGVKTHELIPDGRFGGFAEKWQPMFKEMDSFARLTADTELYSGGVSMIYSQPSVRTYWFLDNVPDEKTYPKRGAAWEVDHNTYIQAAAGWQEMLGELGIHPDFESYLDLEAGGFRHTTPKVLIANLLHSASSSMLAFLKQYVKEGGTLLIDDAFAFYDGRGKPYGPGRIPFTDIERGKDFTYRASFGEIKIPNGSGRLTRVFPLGKGKVIMLDATLARYGESRPDARRHNLRKTAASILEEAGVSPAGAPLFTITPSANNEVCVYRFPGSDTRQFAAVCAARKNPERRYIRIQPFKAGSVLTIRHALTGAPLASPVQVPPDKPLFVEITAEKIIR